ncbi:hypothetical protein AKJ16_DCAP13169 [Drosera capensis]
MDVKSVFLNKELEEEVYVTQLEGFEAQTGSTILEYSVRQKPEGTWIHAMFSRAGRLYSR